MDEKQQPESSILWRNFEAIVGIVTITGFVYMIIQSWFDVSVAGTVAISLTVMILLSAYLNKQKHFNFQTILMGWMVVGLIAVILLLVFPKTMKIEGHVMNTQETPIPGVNVVLYDRLNRKYEMSTNSAGEYFFDEIPTGYFTIDIEHPEITTFAIATTGFLIRSEIIDIIADITPVPVIESTPTLPTPPTEEIVNTPQITISSIDVTQVGTIQPPKSTLITEPQKKISEKDMMPQILIPSGTVLMGSQKNDPEADADEIPQHQVYIDAFWIDKFETSNRSYDECVNAGVCSEPRSTVEFRHSQYADFPVRYVTWEDAKTYCEWVGRRLLTEAEWERAARGSDTRIYPWGNGEPDGTQANFCDKDCPSPGNRDNQIKDGYPRTAPVEEFSKGESPFGVRNMAGNVREWVSDWYNAAYYELPDATRPNPQGPSVGIKRVIRGGSWAGTKRNLRVSHRQSFDPDMEDNIYPLSETGIRCGESYANNTD